MSVASCEGDEIDDEYEKTGHLAPAGRPWCNRWRMSSVIIGGMGHSGFLFMVTV